MNLTVALINDYVINRLIYDYVDDTAKQKNATKSCSTGLKAFNKFKS